MEQNESINRAIAALEDLQQEQSVPKNIKAKVESIIGNLRQEKETSMRVNEALSALDEFSDMSNIQPYIRTQIWNVVSLLESV
jgi:uncharacterized protein (UPF0147 family)